MSYPKIPSFFLPSICRYDVNLPSEALTSFPRRLLAETRAERPASQTASWLRWLFLNRSFEMSERETRPRSELCCWGCANLCDCFKRSPAPPPPPSSHSKVPYSIPLLPQRRLTPFPSDCATVGDSSSLCFSGFASNEALQAQRHTMSLPRSFVF